MRTSIPTRIPSALDFHDSWQSFGSPFGFSSGLSFKGWWLAWNRPTGKVIHVLPCCASSSSYCPGTLTKWCNKVPRFLSGVSLDAGIRDSNPPKKIYPICMNCFPSWDSWLSCFRTTFIMWFTRQSFCGGIPYVVPPRVSQWQWMKRCWMQEGAAALDRHADCH